jgi:alkaline phosphatase D
MTSMPIAGSLYNPDQWDGYAAGRTRLFEQVRASGADNPIVITGDVHASGVGLLVDEGPDPAPVGIELVGTSISSSFTAAVADVAEELIGQIPHVRYINVRKRGYVRCDATADALVAQFRLVDSVATPSSAISTAASWTVEAGHLDVVPT